MAVVVVVGRGGGDDDDDGALFCKQEGMRESESKKSELLSFVFLPFATEAK